MRLLCWISLIFVIEILTAWPVTAQMPTTVKNSTLREENPEGVKELLILPYAFSSETMGLTGGIGAVVKGYGQDQLTLGDMVFAGSDECGRQRQCSRRDCRYVGSFDSLYESAFSHGDIFSSSLISVILINSLLNIPQLYQPTHHYN